MALLRGWGEIAEHLRTSVRTAQRWHAERGLPVAKDGPSQQSRIVAESEQLDEWSRSVLPCSADNPAPPPVATVPAQLLFAGATAVALLAGALILYGGSRAGGSRGWVAYSAVRDGNPDIYVVRDDGTGRTRLTSDPLWDLDPSISPDGILIAFVSNRSGLADLWVMPLAGGNPRPLGVAHPDSPCTLEGNDWSLDGNSIAYGSRIEEVARIFEVPVTGGPPKVVWSGSQDAMSPRYGLEDGLLFATLSAPYNGRTSYVEAIESPTGQPHRVAQRIDTRGADQIYVDGEIRTVYEERLSPTLRRLVMKSPDGEVQSLGFLGDGTATAPVGPRGPGARELSGEFLVSMGPPGRQGIFRASLDGGMIQIAPDGANAYWWVPASPTPLSQLRVRESDEEPEFSAPTPCFNVPRGVLLLAVGAYRFVLFAESEQHVPHVHVTGRGFEFRISLRDFQIAGAEEVDPTEARQIVEIAREHRRALMDGWNAYFAQEARAETTLTDPSGGPAGF